MQTTVLQQIHLETVFPSKKYLGTTFFNYPKINGIRLEGESKPRGVSISET